MSVSNQTAKDRISYDNANKRCMDCNGTPSHLEASVNNGVMICTHCSGKHWNINDVNVSRVLSTKADVWTEKDVKLMEEGGNTRFKAYMKTYELDEIQDIVAKYSTKAADYFRRMIDAKTTKQSFYENKPLYGEGRSLMDGRRLNLEGDIIEEPEEVEEMMGS